MTELTQEGFDYPKNSNVFHLSSSVLNAIAAANYLMATTRADQEGVGWRGQYPPCGEGEQRDPRRW